MVATPATTAVVGPTTTARARRTRRIRRTRRRSQTVAPRWRPTPLLALTALVALAGATVLAYSPAARWLSALNQASVVDRYRSEVAHVEPSAAVQLRRARAYNDALSAGAIVAANTNVPTGKGTSSDPSLDYWKQLRTASGVMARIQIPAIDVDLPIYHGTSQATLRKGAGHLQGTSLPVGGRGTHAVITAHSGLPEATLFSDLGRLEKGDRFTITTFGRVLTYEVDDARVVEPEDTRTLGQEAGRDLVTLVTCTPLGINTHRMLVTGRRVTPTPAVDRALASGPPAGPGFPWFALVYGAALVGVGVYVWWGGRVSPAAGPVGVSSDDRLGGAEPSPRSRKARRAARRAGRRGADEPSGAAVAGFDRLVEQLEGATQGVQRNGLAIVVLDVRHPAGAVAPHAPPDVAAAHVERLRGRLANGDLLAQLDPNTLVVVHADVADADRWCERLVPPDLPAVLVRTDGFHHDAEALIRDTEALARASMPPHGIADVRLPFGPQATPDPDPARATGTTEPPEPDGAPAAGSAAPTERPRVDVDGWLATSDDEFLTRLRAPRQGAEPPDREDRFRP